MTIEERLAGMEARLGKNDELVRELRDAMTATAYMEARQSRLLKDHGEWLAFHDRTMREHDDRMKVLGERIEGLGERIESLVSGIGEFMRRQKA